MTLVRQQLTDLGTDQGRQSARRFFKEDIDAYGVGSPAVKSIARQAYATLKQWPETERNRFCTELFRSGKMEEGVLAVYLYDRFAKRCGESEFKLFESWVDRFVTNWAHCDGVGTKLLAASIANEPTLAARLIPWTDSKNRWKRRAAAISLVPAARRGRHTDEILRIAQRLIADPDEMVQKGVGWVLKETYPPKPQDTMKFLMEEKSRASRLLLRYAAEKMTAADKQKVLG